MTGLALCIAVTACYATIFGSALQVVSKGDGHIKPSTPPKLDGRTAETLIVIPEHKLIFCYIEKVGGTMFNYLFDNIRVLNNPSLNTRISPWLKQSYSAQNMRLTELEQLFVDKDWHKAVFYREPVERFVSSWASKCHGADGLEGVKMCRRQFDDQFKFDEIVDWIREFDQSKDANEAKIQGPWRLQSDFCGGLTNSLEYYDTVEQLTMGTARNRVTQLLRKVGVDATKVPEFDTLLPRLEDEQLETESVGWTKNITSVCNYFTTKKAWVPEALVHHYAPDYDLFKLAAFRLDTQACDASAESEHADLDSDSSLEEDSVGVTAPSSSPNSWYWPLVDPVERRYGSSAPPKVQPRSK